MVTDLSELFKGATAFNADITGWIVEAPNTTDMFYGASAWLSLYMNCGHDPRTPPYALKVRKQLFISDMTTDLFMV